MPTLSCTETAGKKAAGIKKSGMSILAWRAAFVFLEYLGIIIGIMKSDQTCDFGYGKAGVAEIFHAFFNAVLGNKIKKRNLHIVFKYPGA